MNATLTTKCPFDCAALFDLSRDEWLLSRRAGVGASESPILFGVGYSGTSVFRLWADKRGLLPAEEDESEWLAIGREMEPALRSMFGSKTGLPSLPVPSLCIHPEKHWLIASLDHATIDPEHGPCPVELKNVGEWNKSEWEEGTPLRFQVQVQHQMAVTGAKCAYIMGLVGGRKREVRRIERDERFVAKLTSAVEAFWQLVEDNVQPPIDGSAASAAALLAMYPDPTDTEVVLPAEADEWAAELADAKATIKEEEGRKTAMENKIKAAIGDASYGRLPGGGGFSWKLVERKGYVVEPTSFRMLRATKK